MLKSPQPPLTFLNLVVVFAVLTALVGLSNAYQEATSASPQQVSMLGAPPLQLCVILLGKSMAVHGEPIFDVFAEPTLSTDGARVRYDGFTTFIQGETEFTYVLVDGVLYVVESVGNATTSVTTQTAHCLKPSIPFDSMLQALNNATPILSASFGGERIDCPGGSLFHTLIGEEEEFVLCLRDTHGFIAYGKDIVVEVQYQEGMSLNISAPFVDDMDTSCGVGASLTPINPIGHAFLTGSNETTTLIGSAHPS